MQCSVLGAENQQRHISQKQHQAKGAEQLSDHGASEQILDKTGIAKDAQQKPHGCCCG